MTDTPEKSKEQETSVVKEEAIGTREILSTESGRSEGLNKRISKQDSSFVYKFVSR